MLWFRLVDFMTCQSLLCYLIHYVEKERKKKAKTKKKRIHMIIYRKDSTKIYA